MGHENLIHLAFAQCIELSPHILKHAIVKVHFRERSRLWCVLSSQVSALKQTSAQANLDHLNQIRSTILSGPVHSHSFLLRNQKKTPEQPLNSSKNSLTCGIVFLPVSCFWGILETCHHLIPPRSLNSSLESSDSSICLRSSLGWSLRKTAPRPARKSPSMCAR